MNTEDYVTYEQAVKLKELGFNWKCNHYYDNDEFRAVCEEVSDIGGYLYTLSADDFYVQVNPIYQDIFNAPTLAQAAKWLREKGLFIDVWLCAAGYSWVIEKCGNLNCNGTFVAKSDEESGDDEDSGMFTTYEKALSNAIDKALEILKEE